MAARTVKEPYTIPCSSEFRDAVTALAAKKRSNVADLARSVLMLVPWEVIRRAPDPGGPPEGDRERAVLKSGPSKGTQWNRKPRLQMRLAAGYDPSFVRRALGLALALDAGELTLALKEPKPAPELAQNPAPEAAPPPPDPRAQEEIERLKATLSALCFDPLSGGVKSRAEALHVLGFPPTRDPDRDEIRARFRTLATIHHPDGRLGDHNRMSQLNAAMEILGV